MLLVSRLNMTARRTKEFVSFEDAVKTYNIPKWRKTNQSTTVDLKPTCHRGQRVKAGDILTEGYFNPERRACLGT